MQKKSLIVILVTILAFSVAVPTVSAYNGVRAMGMGGAFIAVADDVQSIYWNPAGLTNIKESQLGWQRVLNNRDFSNHLDVVEFAAPLGEQSALGLSYINLADVNDSFFNYRCHYLMLSYGHKVSEKLAVGVNIRTANETLNGSESDFNSADIGILYTASPKLSFGLLVQDAAGRVQIIMGDREANWRPGIAYRPDDKTIIAVDVYNLTQAYNDKREYSFGIEHKLTDTLALWAGNYQGDPTYGIGIKATKDLEINFAYLGGYFEGRKLLGMQTKF